MFKIHFANLKTQPGVNGIYRRLTGRPAWVWGTSLLIGFVPFALAIALLALVALALTAILLLLFTAVDQVAQSLARLLGGPSDGRKNVTVIPSDH